MEETGKRNKKGIVMKEIWKDIPGYEGRYKASNLGRIKSLNYMHTGKEKVLKQVKHYGGYLIVCLCKDGKQGNKLVNVLVWEAFNGPVPQGMQVNHIDEDKTNNSLSNLNLLSPKENCNWGTRNQRMKESLKGVLVNRKDKSKWVIKLSKNYEILHFYQSANQASRETGIFPQNIGQCCLGKQKTAGGFIWKYVE